jgi:hypothetical protein
MNKTLDTKKFEFVGDAPVTNARNKKKRKQSNEIDYVVENSSKKLGRLIIFVIGGISHYEICEL